MVESLVAFGQFRPFAGREEGVEFLPYQYRVFHLALGIARVNVASLDAHGRCRSVEVFKFQFADFASVHRIGKFRPELLHVELDHAAADFFVRGESYLYCSVFDLRMFHEVLHRVHYLRHARLVVRTQQGGSVGGYDGLADVFEKLREFARIELQSRHSLELDGAAVVIADDLRTNSLARGIRRRIDVSDESDGRHFAVEVGREGRHNVSPLVEFRFEPQSLQFVAQNAQKVKLFRCRRL